jgi:23S rRNA pseudouridine1911/1915/1917 synthase
MVDEPQQGPSAKAFEVTSAQANQRLDKVVAEWLPELSRRELRELFESGAVRSFDKVLLKGQLASAGQRIEISEPLAESDAPERPIQIAGESNNWVLVNKPPGLPSAPKHRPDAVSVASQLQVLYPAMAGIGYGPHDAGLLSRLDTGTSGLLLAAKTKVAFDVLRSGARAQALHKVYIGLIAKDARLPEGSIDLPLGPHRSNRRKVAWGRQIAGRTLPARTLVLQSVALDACTLVVLEVTTAYRHQLRAHLAFAGYPLLGDTLYGGAAHPGLTRHALHSYRLRWDGASGVPAFEQSLPLAEDLAQIAGRAQP